MRETTQTISWGVPKRSSPQGTQLGAVPVRWGHPETLRGDTVPQPPASGLREAASVYTCHEGRREKEEAGAEPQTSPPRPGGSPGDAQLGQVDAKRQGGPRRPGGHGWLSSAEPGMPSAGPPLRALPAAFRSRRGEQSPRPSSQARSLADAGRCSMPGAPGRPAPPQPRERGGGGTYLARPGRSRWAWLGGPGRNWLPEEGPVARTLSGRGRKASCSQPCQRSGAIDAHPEFQRCRGTPIPLPSALFRRRRLRLLLLRGDPRPLHTLSHHAAGNRCRCYVTSGRRWLGRGRALVGAGVGEDTPGELVSPNADSCAGAVARNDVRHFGCGQTAFFWTHSRRWSVLRTPSLLARPSGSAPGDGPELLAQPCYFTVAPGSGLSLVLE